MNNKIDPVIVNNLRNRNAIKLRDLAFEYEQAERLWQQAVEEADGEPMRTVSGYETHSGQERRLAGQNMKSAKKDFVEHLLNNLEDFIFSPKTYLPDDAALPDKPGKFKCGELVIFFPPLTVSGETWNPSRRAWDVMVVPQGEGHARIWPEDGLVSLRAYSIKAEAIIAASVNEEA